LATDSSSRAELAAALHRLRSTLARARAELELADEDGASVEADRVLADVREALELLGRVEAEVLSLRSVLVVDDDDRLGELMARGLRRLGYDAHSTTGMRMLKPREIVVVDLGITAALDADARAALKASRPIVLTGATDRASRALAQELSASDYLVKPVELEDLAAAINRRMAEESP
jgi:CheY-like chemotaxis protein